MQLSFEDIGIVGQGKSPDFIQFPKTEGQLFIFRMKSYLGNPQKSLMVIFHPLYG